MYPFKDGGFAPRNAWYVAAFPEQVTRELLTRWILGEPVVLYRREDGIAVAIGGRCPHRYFPLGEGQLIGDQVRCSYHGMTFGSDGRCTNIPSQDAVPRVYRVPSYPLVERGLWMWIWMGDPDKADESLIPTPEEIGLEAPGYTFRWSGPFHVKGRYQLLNDNLLDLTHLGFLHGTSIGTLENTTTPEVRDVNDRRISSRRYIKDAPIPPLLGEAIGYDGRVDRVAGMDFYAPGFHAGLDETSIPEHLEDGGRLLRATKVYHAVTPSTYNETLYFTLIGFTDPAMLEYMAPRLAPVLQEDIFATEQIELMLKRSVDLPPELIVRSDATAVEGRRRIQKMIDAETV